MTRLERILDLLEKYDRLAAIGVDCLDGDLGVLELKELREDKAKLIKELVEHGCRRMN